MSEDSEHPLGTAVTMAITSCQQMITVTTFVRGNDVRLRNQLRARIERWHPIVSAFLALWVRNQETASRLTRMEAVVHTSVIPTLMLDCRGRLVYANRAGEAHLKRPGGLSARHGSIAAPAMADMLRLIAAIAHLSGAGPAEKASVPMLAIKRQRQRPLMVTLNAADQAAGGIDDGAVIACLFDPELDLREVIEPTCRFYGLSVSETRLTRAIVEGASLVEAAETMGVREQTARSYLKQVFLKTETNRQAELVSLMMRSAVRLPSKQRAQLV